ncbi:MAG: DinB family protein [Candidatus Thorarchaeota archaeon]|jgi:hypothetical protein
MSPSPKSIAIDTLEVAETNLLRSFLGVRPEDINKQTHPEFNTVMWILGHCIAHFHIVLCSTCQETELLSEEIAHYFRFGTTKEEISKTETPLTFSRLIDEYLKISASGFSYLNSLEDKDFGKVIFPEYGETLLQSIQRIAFHFMGHVGQIVLIRRALGNPGPTFVGGISPVGRDKIKQKWNTWWSDNKEDFKI